MAHALSGYPQADSAKIFPVRLAAIVILFTQFSDFHKRLKKWAVLANVGRGLPQQRMVRAKNCGLATICERRARGKRSSLPSAKLAGTRLWPWRLAPDEPGDARQTCLSA
jgi:hypothetical protein